MKIRALAVAAVFGLAVVAGNAAADTLQDGHVICVSQDTLVRASQAIDKNDKGTLTNLVLSKECTVTNGNLPFSHILQTVDVDVFDDEPGDDFTITEVRVLSSEGPNGYVDRWVWVNATWQ